MRSLLLCSFFLCANLFSAQLTTTVLVSTNQKCATLYLNLPQPPLSCDSVNDSSLKAYYRLDEASGTAYDAKGTNNLSDVNGATTQVGVIGSSREFTAVSNQRLAIPSNANLVTGDIDFTVWCWARYGGSLDPGLSPGIISKWPMGGANEFTLYFNGDTQHAEFAVSNDGTATTFIGATNYGNVPTSTWIFVCASHDSVNNTLNIQAGTLGTDSLSAVDSKPYSAGVFSGTGDFTVGSIGTGFTWTGQIDEVGFTKRKLTAIEILALYSKGLACRPSGL